MSMSKLDVFQHWALEIGGTILLLLTLYRLSMDLVTGVPSLDILWYIGVFALSFTMMGHKGLAKVLLGK